MKNKILACVLAGIASISILGGSVVYADVDKGVDITAGGKISSGAEVSENDEPLSPPVALDFGTFENTYTADSVYVVLSGKKVLTDASKSGRKLQADEFSFTLKDSKGTVIETVKNDAKGVIAFKDLEFATPGEYTYTIVEEVGTDKHIAYDKSVKTIKVTVTGGNGVLSATTSTTSETPTE